MGVSVYQCSRADKNEPTRYLLVNGAVLCERCFCSREIVELLTRHRVTHWSIARKVVSRPIYPYPDICPASLKNATPEI